ncbi:MAG: FAD-dependent oxidoreductase [Polynucleobacter sp. 24-46-87]|jgi:tRNA 5-methylaminomethyl-2-thiouridine biosynthesis bifunctional protein|nr:MAG: FAD-dependent oxidoreductase [Polynucleobacter sp. 35-46-11]OZA15745.1 MAG: FAD-dependent oxidoreductase [Polynucleobacter sp. 24-46-87]OZA77754.1 MAG: FAD-dependent oxidoreductase [Polynucleobacter sp. 39-46-10]
MTSPQHHDIVVIGAGIAGSSIASELLERGQVVCIVDSAPHPASACSSHAYAIAHPHVGRGAPRLLRLTRIAFLMADARWGKVWNQHGIFQPNKKDKAFNRGDVASYLQSLDLDEGLAKALYADDAMQVCGISQDGIWLPRGASLNLFKATQDALAPHPRLTCCWNTSVARLEKVDANWGLFNAHDELIMTAGKVIIAAALETKNLAASMGVRLPLRPVRGQLSIFSIDAKNQWASKLPRTAISGDGYCLPAKKLPDGNNQWIVGSSFDEGESDLQDWDSSDDFNREQAKGLLNYADGDVSHLQKVGSFVGVRCVAGDRLPIIGALTQRPGIFLAAALGSRGVLWSALAAKLITAQVLEDDFALLARLGFAADLVAALAPARFFAGALAAAPALGALASNSKPILPSAPKAR